MPNRDLTNKIKKLIEVTDMQLGHETQNEDAKLTPRAPYVTSESPPPILLEPVPSKQGEVILLDDHPIINLYNLSFYELKRRLYRQGGSTIYMIIHHFHS